MINNKLGGKCPSCGGPAEAHIVADGFDDSPATFVAVITCQRGCAKSYMPMTAAEMHAAFKLPLSGWSETRF